MRAGRIEAGFLGARRIDRRASREKNQRDAEAVKQAITHSRFPGVMPAVNSRVKRKVERPGRQWTAGITALPSHSCPVHKRTSCGAQNLSCCNTSKGSNVRKQEMEKKFGVTPLN